MILIAGGALLLLQPLASELLGQTTDSRESKKQTSTQRIDTIWGFNTARIK